MWFFLPNIISLAVLKAVLNFCVKCKKDINLGNSVILGKFLTPLLCKDSAGNFHENTFFAIFVGHLKFLHKMRKRIYLGYIAILHNWKNILNIRTYSGLHNH